MFDEEVQKSIDEARERKASTQEENVETVEAEIVDTPATGTPVPTNELNPNNKSTSSDNSGKSPGGGLPFSSFLDPYEEYKPLFENIIKAIDQLDGTCTESEKLADRLIKSLNRCEHKVWLLNLWNIVITTCVIAILIKVF